MNKNKIQNIIDMLKSVLMFLEDMETENPQWEAKAIAGDKLNQWKCARCDTPVSYEERQCPYCASKMIWPEHKPEPTADPMQKYVGTKRWMKFREWRTGRTSIGYLGAISRKLPHYPYQSDPRFADDHDIARDEYYRYCELLVCEEAQAVQWLNDGETIENENGNKYRLRNNVTESYMRDSKKWEYKPWTLSVGRHKWHVVEDKDE